MEIIGYICAVFVGISLGVLGSGGSILTVPIMVYLFHINPIEATGYSLFVVGITSSIGGVKYIRKNLVNLKAALIFAIPSIISVFTTRKLLVPAIPNPVIASSLFTLSKELFIMLLFAALMIAASYNMIRNGKYKEPDEKEFYHFNYSMLLGIGIASGFLTGIVGVGGGFIIIPALVLFAKIPIKMSVGTSLLIIAANSFIGFIGEILVNHEVIDYRFLALFALFSAAGIFISFPFVTKIPAVQIRKLFGWFILIVGVGIFMKEFFFRS